jgi:carotenoid cleavage dioxygenase
MARPFPEHPNLVGGFAPIQMECDASNLIIEGEIPLDLQGTFFRVGPNPQFAPRGQYHWFGGDGMIHGFHIENGLVSYKNRWARTVKWNLEHEAGESLFATFNPMENDPRVAGVKTDGIANTNIVWHGNKLLALVESHPPFELDPVTLQSKGSWTFDGKLKGAMTAHPKIDPETGEMLFFAYNAEGTISNRMAFHVADKDGNLIRSEWFDAPYAAMVHDFITTADHVIFPIMPLTGSMERAMQGGPVYAWEPDKGVHIGIMPRTGTVEDIRWFKGDPAYVFHPMNAFSADGIVTCDVCEYGQAPLFPHADGGEPDRDQSKAKLTRWTFDLNGNTDTYSVEQLDDIVCEFPRLDERYAGLKYRHGYMACNTVEDAVGRGYNAIAHVDHQTNQILKYEMPGHFATSEPVFVPRNAEAEEGQGYLLANVYDATIDKSHLMILDAQNIDKGPVGKAMLDHRVPFGFHGNWCPL